jgi:hypothetical protein
LEVGSKRLLMSLFLFGIGSTAGLSFFELSMESKTIFTLDRAWSTASLLDESKVNRLLVKGNGSRDKVCNYTNIGIGVLVELTSLAMRVEGLIDGKG